MNPPSPKSPLLEHTSSVTDPPSTVSRGTQTEPIDIPFFRPPLSSDHTAAPELPTTVPPDITIAQDAVVDDQPEDALIPESSMPQIQFNQPGLTMSRHMSPSQSSSNRLPQYELVSPGSNFDPRAMSKNNKDQLIHSLRTHKVNTITELRRIEKIFAFLDSSEVTEPMTAAWAHYVNSNNLLNELRGLTKSYPFSSECLDEAKSLVVRDPQSIRSWNYCWLVLLKMEKEGLVAKHARALAMKPAMWGNKSPTAEGVQRLANACNAEWTRALRQMLRHWDRPPSTTGN